jgi:hypothetical protein
VDCYELKDKCGYYSYNEWKLRQGVPDSYIHANNICCGSQMGHHGISLGGTTHQKTSVEMCQNDIQEMSKIKLCALNVSLNDSTVTVISV